MAPKAKSSKSSPSQSALSPTLQKLFVGAAGLMFVMQVVQNVYYLTQQMPENDNFSAYFSWFFGIGIVVLTWFIVYLSRNNHTMNLRTVFDVTLVTVSTIMVTAGLGWLTSFVQLPFVKDSYDVQWYVAMYQALPFAVALPLLVIVIRRLRAAKQW